MIGLFDAGGGGGKRMREPLAARMRPRTLDEFVGQEQIVGPGRALRRAIESDQAPSMILWGPPGTGQDDARADHRAADRRALRRALRGERGRRRPAPRRRRRAEAARRGTAHRAVHRRDPPLQQSAAGRGAAVRRGRHRHADRRDHGEPVVRGELRAAVALARVRAQGARRRRRAHADRARAARRRARPGQSRTSSSRPTRSTRW